MKEDQAIALRAKKLGVLIRDARLAAGKSMRALGEDVAVSASTISAYERGKKSPSLPELELIAYSLDIPVEHFWGEETKSIEPAPREQLDLQRLLALRHRIIGIMLRKARKDAGLSFKALSQETGLPASRLKRYETGKKGVSLPELEALAASLNLSVREFYDQHGPVGDWATQQRNNQEFSKLPPELQEFLVKPVNRPYLDLALRLSELSVDELRSVAEGLLEISL